MSAPTPPRWSELMGTAMRDADAAAEEYLRGPAPAPAPPQPLDARAGARKGVRMSDQRRNGFDDLLLENGWLQRVDGLYENIVTGEVLRRVLAIKKCPEVRTPNEMKSQLSPDSRENATRGENRHTPRRPSLDQQEGGEW